ncbi:MAG: DNA gyrase subunit A [Verrucomicrobiota bacterium]|nr:DNA gyrase subunit A [Verrucomicrobiota bacterium]
MSETEQEIKKQISNDIPANIEDLMHSAYLQYSLSVNIGRAIPDVRDGLKPGNRRILYAMRQLNLTKSHAYTKCAKVVGEVIGNYHPHGDQSVYDTLVRMAQDFNMRYPLIDGQGNFGSIDGDAAAAYRYTECRMERLTEELLTDINKDTVDMVPTFDETTLEPTVLPAKFPNLLVMGGTGIGVGMATSIPPHNLDEVINATVHLVDTPDCDAMDLMGHIPGPDFPTGASIVGKRAIQELYTTGHGIIRIRGKAEIIEEKSGAEKIIITELPYMVNKERLILKIADLVKNDIITGISALNDISSSRVGIKIVIDVKRNAFANIVLNRIYKHTPLEHSMGCQFLVVDKNQPRQLNLKQLLQAYIDHRYEVICRRNMFDLRKAEARAHILEALRIAVDNLDEVIKIIRHSRTKDDAFKALVERFEFSKEQTDAILNMRMHQLTGLAIEALNEEYDELQKVITYLKSLLASRELTLEVLKEELLEVRDKYTSERRTIILPDEEDFNYEDLIAREIFVLTISKEGYIKRMKTETFRTQHRGGRGVIGMQTKEDDYVEHLFTVCSHDYILFFTNKGKMRWLKVYEIPEGSRTSKGKAIINLLQLEKGESVRAMITVDELDVEDKYIIMATKKGIINKTELRAFKNLRNAALNAIKLDDDDDLIEAKLTDGESDIIISSTHGRACRFKEKDVRPTGRNTRGVRGIRLAKEDQLVDMSVVKETDDLFVVTSQGMGKRTHLGKGNAEEDKDIIGGYRLTKRGGKGVINIKLKEDDSVVGVLQLNEDVEIMLTTVKGQLVRIPTEQITPKGRATQGVRVMRLKKDDYISGVSKVMKLDEEDEESGEEVVDPEVENIEEVVVEENVETPEVEETSEVNEEDLDKEKE